MELVGLTISFAVGLREEGFRIGEKQNWPLTNVAWVRFPGVTCGTGLNLLVLYSAPRGFSPGTPVFVQQAEPL